MKWDIKVKKVMITGGAGFIGSRLANNLKENANVVVYDSFLEQVHGGIHGTNELLEGVEVVKGDVRDSDALEDIVKKTNPDIIYHLASETGTGQSFDEPTRYNSVNVMGTSHLVEAVRKHGKKTERIVLAGSRSVYGEGACVDANGNPAMAVERSSTDLANAVTPVAPASIYASTKLFQEYLLSQAFWGTDTKVGILRLQNVFGAGQSLNNPYTGVISIFTNQIKANKRLNIYEDGDIVRDFVYVDDVVRAFALMGSVQNCDSAIIDIGYGQPISVIDMAELLLTKLGQPKDKYDITGDFRAGDIRFAVADVTMAKKLLNWTPEVSFESGVDKFLEWAN